MIKEAYVRFNVKCNLDDKTAIPNYMSVSFGEPDETGEIEYSCGAYLTGNQLKAIYAILSEKEKVTKKRKCTIKKLEYARKYYKKNKDKFKAYMKEYRKTNKDYYTSYNKIWRENKKNSNKISEIINDAKEAEE